MNSDDATRPDGLRLASGRPLPLPPAPATRTPWNVPVTWLTPDLAPEEPGESGEPVRPLTALMSFHYLRAAVRRRRAFGLLCALIGTLLGAAFLLVAPASHSATATLVLNHDNRADAARAMDTDVSLATTRTVAEHTIAALGLSMEPESIQKSVTAVPTTSDVLVVTLSGPSDAEAVRRLSAFVTAYLDFRSTQVSAQSDVLIQGYNDRIGVLQAQVTELSNRIATLAATGGTATDRLSDAVGQRAQIAAQISGLQQSAQDETLRRNAVVSTSRVIDPAAAVRGGGKTGLALALASGLIGGAALGFGTVVLQAILSDRLRLRVEVASALEVPVPVSVGRITPLARPLRWLRFLPWIKPRAARRDRDLQRMVQAIEKALPEPGRRQRLALVCLDNADEVRLGVAAAAAAMQLRGRTVYLVDLTEAGGLDSTVARLMRGSQEGRPTVFRPTMIPTLAKGPTDIASAGPDEDQTLAMGMTGVCLVLADLDPGVGADHLTAWTERAVVVVTGGRSGVERVRTAGDLVRSAGLDFRSAVLIRAEGDDASSGMAPTAGDDGTARWRPAAEPAPGASAGGHQRP